MNTLNRLLPLLIVISSLSAGAKPRIGAGFRATQLAVPESGRAGFTELSPQLTGITFTNSLAPSNAAANQILLNGSGVAAGDIDGDGRCDLYFCGLERPNVLYRNLGNWKFEDITEAAGVACVGQPSTGAVLADVDGDGDLDLLVNSVGGGTRLFLNDGKGRFTEDTNAGLVRRFGSTSMALADIDGDGDLDLYVANYRTTTIRSTGFDILNVDGRRMLRPEDRDRLYVTPDGFLREYGEVDVVYLNDGKGHFQPLSWTDGRFHDANGQALTVPPRDWALSVMFRDMNGDGAPDIYVCNDFWSPDKIWINDGAGCFRQIAREALPCISTFSMCMDFADINRDGLDDFLVLDMKSPDHTRRVTQTIMFGVTPWPMGYSLDRLQVTRNTLFLNRGDGTYAEIAQMCGLDATDWSWCPIFLDVDLDGYEDLLIATGNTFDTQDQDAEEHIRSRGPWPREKVPFKLLMYPPLLLPKMAFRNRGDLTFEDAGKIWGFNSVGVAQGMCLADLDGDGDLDVIVNNLNSGPSLFRNESPKPRIAVRLNGLPPNTRGIGAKIRVYDGPVPLQSQEMICGGRYLSSDDAPRVFAAGTLGTPMRLEVQWRSGKHSMVTNALPNCLYEVDEAGAGEDRAPESKAGSPASEPRRSQTPVQNAPLPAIQPMFEDVSDLIKHAHGQEPFNDFTRQPLLPRKLSQLGPGVAWYDVDNDGREDLLIAGGRGGQLAVYLNDGRGGFSRLMRPALIQPAAQNQTTVLGWHTRATNAVVLAGSSNYEDGSRDAASVVCFNFDGPASDSQFPGNDSSAGPLAMADIDGDGDLDLFVGGRVVPGRYPEPASSRLFRNNQDAFDLDRENSQVLDKIGLVSAAVFADLDNDGDPDLLLACEWGPIRYLRNDRGRFTDVTDQAGLGRYPGWWNGVAVGDFDGDGRLDIVASNWGRNTPYETHRSQPQRLYYGDFNGAGQVDIVEAYHDSTMGKLVPELAYESVAGAMPFIRERIASHKAFGLASLEEILGDRFKSAHELAANTLESMVFLNHGGHFEAQPLPVEAQMAPAFGVSIGDMDGDGCEDIFLSQNFFGPQPQTSPYDAGRGLWLNGDGHGGFQAVPGQTSGVKLYGEQRGCALADYDQDGRVDLVVTQNSGPTRLFHNRGAKPGLRVRLEGPPGNPYGIGAQVRLMFGAQLGPMREIHAGAGYWSQDGPTQVLAMPQSPTAVWIRWPWGNALSNAIPADAREITIDTQGKVESVRKR